jgi:2-polyprenyl-3-methyl-5-hydroxy-6-metoxy-1,4-benzoquinol methylase
VTDEEIRAGMDEIMKAHGAWTAHDIRLSEKISTYPGWHQGSADGVRRYMQIAADLFRRPWEEMSFLDLGCLEGLYAIDAGLRGCKRSVGIDIREQHIAKAEFAKKVLGLPNTQFLLEDVRGLSPERHGMFDIILCNGLLYHLDTPDVFTLLKVMRTMTMSALIIDTHIALTPERTEVHEGCVYSGASLVEFLAGTPLQTQLQKAHWSSAGNERSFWPTKSSLLNALRHAGFTSVYESFVPYQPHTSDRLTLVALPGKEEQSRAAALAFASPADWPER